MEYYEILRETIQQPLDLAVTPAYYLEDPDSNVGLEICYPDLRYSVVIINPSRQVDYYDRSRPRPSKSFLIRHSQPSFHYMAHEVENALLSKPISQQINF
jgi:hypothetical protein